MTQLRKYFPNFHHALETLQAKLDLNAAAVMSLNKLIIRYTYLLL